MAPCCFKDTGVLCDDDRIIPKVTIAYEGIVRLSGVTCKSDVHAAYSTDALHLALPSSSLSCRDHQSQRLVVFSVRSQLSRCRRNVSDARRGTHLRNSQSMVPLNRPIFLQISAS